MLLIGINTLSQPKFKIGDRVKVRTSNQAGVIKQVIEADSWNMFGSSSNDYEYRIDFDDGSNSVIVEKVLDLTENVKSKCTCGAVFTSFSQIHSDWCDYNKFGMSYNDGTGD